MTRSCIPSLVISSVLVTLAVSLARAQGATPRSSRDSPSDDIRSQLIGRYNERARGISSLNARAVYSASGEIPSAYGDIKGFILAQKPSHIRVVGQAQVIGNSLFDVAGDAQMYRIFLPTKNMFIIGANDPNPKASRPLERLCPQQLFEALFWAETPASVATVEQISDSSGRYYVLTLRRGDTPGAGVARKIWFDRRDLNVARIQIFGSEESVDSDIRYAKWSPVGREQFPMHLWVARPRENYQLEVRILSLVLNEELSEEQFRLEQPPGTELIIVGKD